MKDVLLAKGAVSAANFSIDKPYTYQIPETFAQQVTVGCGCSSPSAEITGIRRGWCWRWSSRRLCRLGASAS